MKFPYAELGKVFWIKHQSYSFSLSEMALYFFLLDCCNNGRWENPFLLPTRRIVSELGIKEDTITQAKRRLKSVGLIDFSSIQGSKFAHYQLVNLPIKSATMPEGLTKLPESSGQVPAKQPKKSATFSATPILDQKDKDKDNKESPTPLLDLPFEEEAFSQAWENWMAYKKQIRDEYKSEQSIPQALKNLVNLSHNDCQTAIAIIHQSIGNGWKGLFALKNRLKSSANSGASLPGRGRYCRQALIDQTTQLIQQVENGELDLSRYY